MRARIVPMLLVLGFLSAMPSTAAASVDADLSLDGLQETLAEKDPQDKRCVESFILLECEDDGICVSCQSDGDFNGRSNRIFKEDHVTGGVDHRLLGLFNDKNDIVYDGVSDMLGAEDDDPGGRGVATGGEAPTEDPAAGDVAQPVMPWSTAGGRSGSEGAHTRMEDPRQVLDEGDDDAAPAATAYGTIGDVVSTQTVLLVAAVGALLAFLYVAVRTSFLAPLFSRFEKGDVLKNGTRAGLHQRVEENPGIHLRALVEGTGLARSTVVHHLAHLERHGLIRSRTVGRSRHFFANGSGYAQDQKEAYAVLQNARSRDVLAFLQQEPGADRNRIGAAMGMSWNLTQWYMKRLLDAGLVHGVKRGRSVAFFLTHTARKAALTGPTAAAAASA